MTRAKVYCGNYSTESTVPEGLLTSCVGRVDTHLQDPGRDRVGDVDWDHTPRGTGVGAWG